MEQLKTMGWGAISGFGIGLVIGAVWTSTAAKRSRAGSWEMYFPGPIAKRRAKAQIGAVPFNFVMRLHDGKRWLYRLPTAEESAVLELQIGEMVRSVN